MPPLRPVGKTLSGSAMTATYPRVIRWKWHCCYGDANVTVPFPRDGEKTGTAWSGTLATVWQQCQRPSCGCLHARHRVVTFMPRKTLWHFLSYARRYFSHKDISVWLSSSFLRSGQIFRFQFRANEWHWLSRFFWHLAPRGIWGIWECEDMCKGEALLAAF